MCRRRLACPLCVVVNSEAGSGNFQYLLVTSSSSCRDLCLYKLWITSTLRNGELTLPRLHPLQAQYLLYRPGSHRSLHQ